MVNILLLSVKIYIFTVGAYLQPSKSQTVCPVRIALSLGVIDCSMSIFLIIKTDFDSFLLLLIFSGLFDETELDSNNVKVNNILFF